MSERDTCEHASNARTMPAMLAIMLAIGFTYNNSPNMLVNYYTRLIIGWFADWL